MKRFFTSVLALFLLSVSFASKPAINPNPMHASQIMIPVGTQGQKISLLALSKISKADLEKITGKKMNPTQSFAFKGAQRKMNKGINSDGIISGKRMKKMFFAGSTGFHGGGFALGFFVGLIGVLIAYLIKDDYKKNRVKWAWIGLGVNFLLTILLIAVVLSTVVE